mgnify:FL=1|tara:strand:+ start:231 stop:722 length:492 start_codon:yes stop_codon:yes gene_type:complete
MRSVLNWFVLGFGLLASASSFAESGSYKVVAMSAIEFKSIETNDGSLASGHMTTVSTVSEGSGILKTGMVGTGDCIVQVVTHSSGKDISATCSMHYVDLESKLFMSFDRKSGDIATSGAKGDGLGKIVGGTGKLSGISGSCAYTIKYIDANRSVTMQDCNYSL